MDEPLLGSQWRPRIIPRSLCQIPEETGSEDGETIPISPSSLKEHLIYGPANASPQSRRIWLGHPPFPEQHSGDDADAQLYLPSNSSLQEAVESFDDSFIDSRVIGAHGTEAKLSTDLTKFDFDVRAQSPRTRSSSSLMASWLMYEKDAGRRHVKSETTDRAHTISIPPDLQTRKTTVDDPNYANKRQLHRAWTAPTLIAQPNKETPRTTTTSMPSLPTCSVVSQAFIGLLLYLAVGVLIYSLNEDEFSGSTTHYFVDAIYFCIVTMCTIGYGDIAPISPGAKLFSCAFVLVGFGFIDVLLSGMVSYVLDQQETLLLSAVAAGQHQTAKNYLVDIEKGRMRIRSKVTLAFGVVVMCIGVGTLVMHFLENLGWLDSFYLSCMSVTTVGYGDHAFKSKAGRLFASVWLLVSTLAVARSFLYLAEARIDKRHRLIAKLVLEKEMTIGDLLAADFDNDGNVSKSDFVVYKLKQMGRILEKDIAEVCKQFSRLDTTNSGKISLSCLINLRKASPALQ